MFNPKEHLIDLKGKKYLPVAWRLVWFREEKPDWQIKTQLANHDQANKLAIMHCEIINEKGIVVSTAYGSESASDFKDYLEKAETKAVGRALGMLGYGTQFAPEFDEGDKVVDTPQELSRPKMKQKERSQEVPCDECNKMIPRSQAVATYKRFGLKLCDECAGKISPHCKDQLPLGA